MDKVEQLARVLCTASTDWDPDTKVYFGDMPRITGVHLSPVYAIEDAEIRPLWRMFVSIAHEVLDAGFDRPADEEQVADPAPKIGDRRQNGSNGVVEVYGESGWVEEMPPIPAQGEAWRERMGLTGGAP